MIDGIGKERRVNRNYPNGLGYVVIPSNEDRQKYVETCLRTERVSIQLDFGGGVIPNCYVLTHILSEIKFPETVGKLGSCVAFMSDEYHAAPIIIGVISKMDESQLLEENIVRKTVVGTGGRVNLEANGNTGELFINVDSDYESGGAVHINLNSKNNTAKFDVKCFGEVNIYSEGDITLETLKTANIQCSYVDGQEKKFASKINLTQDGFTYEDKTGNIIQVVGENINIKPVTRLNVFEGGSPMVLGDILKTQLEIVTARIDNALLAIKTAPATGLAFAYQAGMKVILATQLTKESFENINSEKSYTD